MKVVLPYTEIDPRVLVRVAASGYPVQREDVGLTDESYFWLLADLWDEGETFAIVEHDIVVGPDTLASLDACPGAWCSFPYAYINGYHYGLGCVKFDEALIRRNPNAMRTVGTMSDEGHLERHWCRLDGWLLNVLNRAGETMCQHWPMVEHRTDTTHSSHGCI